MKPKFTFLALLLAASLAVAQDRLADQIRKAIVEEESNRNLDKAVQAYQSILKQFDEERATAATALFHLAECYRKLGKNDLAAAAYQRVVREFADQSKLADASRNNLSKNTTFVENARKTADMRTTEARQRYRVLLEQEIRLVEGQIVSMQRRVETGLAAPEGPEMTALKKELLELKRTMAAFDAGAMPIPANIIK